MAEEENFPLENLQTIEKLYRDYRRDPKLVDSKWRPFFAGMEFADVGLGEKGGEELTEDLRVFRLLLAYRRFGHLLAKVNPLIPPPSDTPPELDPSFLGFSESDLSKEFPTLGFLPEGKAPLQEIITALQKIYSSRVGIEYMDLDNPEMEEWIQKRVEPRWDILLSLEEKKLILEYLNKAEVFESFLHTKYVGQKRFSLEGGETLIPLLWGIIELGLKTHVEEFILGMAHRGRLNVLTNILQKSYAVLFHEFESALPPGTGEGTSDVKYHKGFASDVVDSVGNKIHLHLVSNPSHLESVDPVVLGEVRAKQVMKEDSEKTKVIPILIHGDASFSGQGIVYECLQFMHLEGYSTGGTIHIVVNNQIGFTTLPEEGRSTRYCTDIAKAFGCPVFHVSAEDPESCYLAAKMALEIRQKFHKDVVIDLICYRKYGHNEGDEPAFTQPLEYLNIRQRPSVREVYVDQLALEGALEKQIAEKFENDFRNTLHDALLKTKEYAKTPPSPEDFHGDALKSFQQAPDSEIFIPLKTSVDAELLQKIALMAEVPAGFSLHPKLVKWLEERKEKFSQDPKTPVFDWAFCEYLAFGSILWEGVPIRLAGQDSQRGTFSHRHAVWVDQKNAERYFSLQHLKKGQGRFDVFNSPLSEYAALGFEYGYSLASPQTDVLWEAQYGDFTNTAQVIIDQYIASAEQKWRRFSSLTLLLPHGFEGQGPEHSSARIERFLQLSGHNNIQVVNPTTPAQFFHLLRRQALRKLKKPLIVLTPKSLLRLPACVSSLNDLTKGEFEEILDDPIPASKVKRLLFTSGRIFYDLIAEREKRKAFDHVIIRVEQFYPFHEEKCKKYLAKYKDFQECCWVQDEPENMGGWDFMRPRLEKLLGREKPLVYIGRERSASPATGSHHKHQIELEEILQKAFKS